MSSVLSPTSVLGRYGLLLVALASLSACASDRLSPDIQRGDTAYTTMDATASARSAESYRIGPYDIVNVSVFDEPQLSVTNAEVDSEGKLALPLLGQILASGLTTEQLSANVEQQLSPDYVKHPRVMVTVGTSEARKITVEGEVKDPGIYSIRGETTLLQAMALAKGETTTAKLSAVIVFRTYNGKRMAALFDLNAIRTGRAPDPQIMGRDVIVVGLSRARRLWEDTLQAIPVFNIFRAF